MEAAAFPENPGTFSANWLRSHALKYRREHFGSFLLPRCYINCIGYVISFYYLIMNV